MILAGVPTCRYGFDRHVPEDEIRINIGTIGVIEADDHATAGPSVNNGTVLVADVLSCVVSSRIHDAKGAVAGGPGDAIFKREVEIRSGAGVVNGAVVILGAHRKGALDFHAIDTRSDNKAGVSVRRDELMVDEVDLDHMVLGFNVRLAGIAIDYVMYLVSRVKLANAVEKSIKTRSLAVTFEDQSIGVDAATSMGLSIYRSHFRFLIEYRHFLV